MKRGLKKSFTAFQIISFFVILVSFSLQVFGAEEIGTKEISLQEALALSQSHPSVKAQETAVKGAILGEKIIRHQLTRPQLFLEGSIQKRSRNFDLETPMGPFTLGEQSGKKLDITLVQPVFQPGGFSDQLPAAQKGLESKEWALTTKINDQAKSVASSFFDVLILQDQVKMANKYCQNLASRLTEANDMVAAGRLLDSDRMKIELGLESARYRSKVLNEQLNLQLLTFRKAVHTEKELVPVWDDKEPLPQLPEAISIKQNNRPELKGLETQKEALDLQEAAIKKENWPKVQAIVRYSDSAGEPLGLSNMAEGRLQVTWTPFKAGTRRLKAAQVRLQSQELDQRLEDLTIKLDLGLQASLSQLRIADSALELAEKSLLLAEETLRVDRERFMENRSKANDLLDSEFEKFKQETQKETQKWEYLKAYFNFKYQQGFLWDGVTNTQSQDQEPE